MLSIPKPGCSFKLIQRLVSCKVAIDSSVHILKNISKILMNTFIAAQISPNNLNLLIFSPISLLTIVTVF